MPGSRTSAASSSSQRLPQHCAVLLRWEQIRRGRAHVSAHTTCLRECHGSESTATGTDSESARRRSEWQNALFLVSTKFPTTRTAMMKPTRATSTLINSHSTATTRAAATTTKTTTSTTHIRTTTRTPPPPPPTTTQRPRTTTTTTKPAAAPTTAAPADTTALAVGLVLALLAAGAVIAVAVYVLRKRNLDNSKLTTYGGGALLSSSSWEMELTNVSNSSSKAAASAPFVSPKSSRSTPKATTGATYSKKGRRGRGKRNASHDSLL